ncbi:MAG: amidohydrolase [Aggregatilineales bacterium]
MTTARPHAELLLHHGTIHTLDPAHPLAEAVAISNGKILAVGALDELETLTHANTRRIDLQGRTLIPGFNDAHIHLWKVGMLLTQMIDTRLTATPTIPAIVEAFRAKAAQMPVGSWLTGRGYHELTLPERRHPTRHDLDTASAAHPIQLIHTSAHAAVVNSRALELAGITRDTPNPPGGEIEHDEHGEPTGLLRETAMGLVNAIAPPPTAGEFEAALLAAAKICLRLGITSITEPGITPDQIAVYRTLKDARRLPIRANVMASRYAPDNHKLPLPERYESDWLRSDTVKLFADGGLSSGTAALSVSYPNQNGKRGLPRYTDEQLLALVWDIHRAGLRAAIHAIGDAAIEQALKAVEYASGRLVSRMRHRIEHFGLPNASQLARAQHRVSVVPQAVFLPALGDGFLAYTPPELLGQLYPLRAMKDAGLMVALSSDAPVVPDFNPLLGIKAAADRLSASGVPIAPDQAIEVADALRMYTVNGAVVAGESTLKGSLSPGKLADMAVLSGDPLRAPVERLTDLQVEMTILNGQIVYSG